MAEELTPEEIIGLLERCDTGVLSTIGRDGFPRSVPVNYVFLDGRVCIHGRPGGGRMEDVVRDPRVCFTVWEAAGYEECGPDACNTATVYESVVVKGRMEVVGDVSEKTRVLSALVDKIVPGDRTMDPARVEATAVYRIIPVEVTGRCHRPHGGNPVHPRVREF